MKKGKRGAAKDLYLSGYSQADVSRILRTSINTIKTWASKDDWRGARLRLDMLESNSVNSLMEIFEYQVKCLKEEKERRMESGEMIPFTPGEFDALQKLFSTIKPDFNKFRLHVSVVKGFTEFLQSKDVELAKKVLPHADLYLNEKHKAL